MTFIATESSVFDGEPIETYEFNRGAEYWRYTSYDEDVTSGGQLYTSRQIKRESLSNSQELSKTSLLITTSRDLPLVEQFISTPPSDEISLTLRRYHATDVDNEIAISWIGRIVNVAFKGEECSVQCESILTALNRPGLRRLYQRNCPHALYGSSCGVNKNAFRSDAASASISGVTVQATEFSLQTDGYFTGGELEYENERSSIDRRMIVDHVGDTITLASPIYNTPAVISVSAYAGCPHTIDICRTRFNNKLNYGGMVHIPTNNPFGTNSSIF